MVNYHIATGLLALSMFVACGGGDDDDPFVDGGTIDGAVVDAMPTLDSTPVNCTADRNELGEDSNDLFQNVGVAELTGQSLMTGGSFTICGEINPAQQAGSVADADFYQFTVVGDTPVETRIELVAPDGSMATNLTVSLWVPSLATQGAVGVGTFTVTHGLVTDLALPEGEYWIGVWADDVPTATTIGYTVTVRENPFVCPPDMNTPTFVEADDGALSRGNDMMSVTYGNGTTIILTPDPVDVPEATAIVTADATVYHLQGISADVASGGDDYLDRDTFAITTGTDTTELTVRVSWPDASNADVDAFLFEALMTGGVASGTIIGIENDELFTAIVQPNTEYWIWAATYDDPMLTEVLPLTYDITICSRNFTP